MGWLPKGYFRWAILSIRRGSVATRSARLFTSFSANSLAIVLFMQLSCRHCCLELGHIFCRKLFTKITAFAVAAKAFL